MDSLAPFRDWLAPLSFGDLVAFLWRATVIATAGHAALFLLRRAPAAARHLAATVALAAMLALPVALALLPAWPALRVPVAPAITGLADRALPAAPEFTTPIVEGSVNETTSPTPPPVVDWNVRAAAVPTPAPAIANVVPIPAGPPLGAAGATALAVIAVAALLLLVRAAGSWFASWLAWRATSIDREDVRLELRDAALRLGLRPEIPVRRSARVPVPVVVGLAHPVLLLPDAALEWPSERRRAVLLHELAHIARRDGVALAVARVATAIYWFHPLAWTLARAARLECERACDDTVLRAGVRASDYAEHLLTVARDMVGAPLMGATLAFARPSSLEGRLIAILRPDARRAAATGRAVALAAAAACLFLVPLTSLRVVAAPRAAARGEAAPVPEERAQVLADASRRESTRWNTAVKTSESTTLASSLIASTSTRASKSIPPDDSRSGEDWYSEAREAYGADQFERSGEAYENAARAGYREDTAWYNAACSWALAGKRNRSLGALQAALDAGFSDLDLVQTDDDLASIRSDGRYRLLVQAALQSDEGQRKLNKSQAQYDALKDSGTRDASSWRAAGISLLRAGDADRAAKAFEAEVALDSSASGIYNLACAQARGNHASLALATLERAVLSGFGDAEHVASDPDLVSLHGKPEFERLVKLTDDLTLFSNGRDDDDSEAWKRDLPRFQRVTRDYPKVGRGWFNLGYAELRLEHLDASATAFGRALDLGYRRGTTSYNLACVAARRGEADQAFSWLDRAESAGMEVAGMAAGDDDLESLHGDPRFHAMTDKWKWDHRSESRAAKEKEKEKNEEKKKEKSKDK